MPLQAAPVISFEGRVATGRGEAVSFTAAAWAREAFVRLVGIDPFPGTLNLEVAEGRDRTAWAALKVGRSIPLPPPDPAWCAARLYPVWVARRVPGAIVLPDVADYPPGQVEIIAAVRLRAVLGLEDGDPVTVAERIGGPT